MPSNRSRGRTARIITAVILALLIGGGLLLAINHQDALNDRGNQISFVHLILIFVFVAMGLSVRSMRDVGQSLKYAGVWSLIFAGLVIAHGFQGEAKGLWNRLLAGLNPGSGLSSGSEISFQPSHGGHFVINADVDGTTLNFLVDTGASRVVLSPSDATKLGIDIDNLAFTQVFQTANGIGYGAPIRLRRIAIGPVVVTNVRASVNQAPMSTSLLGMTFLQETGGYSVQGGVLTLKP